MSKLKNREDIYIHSQDVTGGTLYVAYTVHQNRITQISGPTFKADSVKAAKSTKKNSGAKND